MTVADRIRNKRIELGLSQTDLAKLAKYSDKTRISKIENSGDDISMKQIQRVASALNVSAASLMGWEEFTNDVVKGKVDLDEMNHAIEMYELYKNSTPKVQSMVEYLLEEGNSKGASQQD